MPGFELLVTGGSVCTQHGPRCGAVQLAVVMGNALAGTALLDLRSAKDTVIDAKGKVRRRVRGCKRDRLSVLNRGRNRLWRHATAGIRRVSLRSALQGVAYHWPCD